MDPVNVVNLATSEQLRGLQGKIRELELKIADRDLELLAMRALLRVYEQQSTSEDSAGPPPAELVHAIRSASHSRNQPVWVKVDGAEVLVIVDGAARAPDPAAEAESWRAVRAFATAS